MEWLLKTRAFLLFVILLLARCAGMAQGTISTIAGGSGFLDNVPAIQARLDGPQALAIESQGNAFISDGLRIRRVDARTGLIATVAGTGNRPVFGVGDGPATEVGLNGPSSFALDSSGNLLFLDSNVIRK